MNNDERKKGRIVLVLMGLMVSLLLSALDSTVVSTAMKRIAENLGGMEYYAWPFTTYMLCSTISVLVCGGLADIFGHKRVFLAGIVLFLAGSGLCGLSRTIFELIAFRGVQGIGGGIIVSGVFTIVADLFEPARRGTYTGIVTSMYGLASIVGPLAGGFITDTWGWRFIFFLNFPLGLAALILVAVTVPANGGGPRKRTVDYYGILALVLALVPLLLEFSLAGKNFAWLSAPSVALLCAAGGMTVLFIVIEKRAANPMLPPTFFADRAVSGSFAIAFLSQAIMFSAIMYLPYFIQGIIGSSATTSGVIIMPMMLGLLLASNITGRLVSRTGRVRRCAVLAFLVMAAGECLLATMDVSTPYGGAILFMVILGYGVGMSMPLANVNAQNASPRQQVGAVTSAVMFFRNIGSTIGSAVYGIIMSTSLHGGLARLDMQRIPASVRTMLEKPQVITSRSTIAQMATRVPQAYRGYFSAAYAQARHALVGSVHAVFLFCVGLAAVGVIAAACLREATPQATRKPAAPVC